MCSISDPPNREWRFFTGPSCDVSAPLTPSKRLLS
jgi:hypothetical protein